jgi:hypothetical protein
MDLVYSTQVMHAGRHVNVTTCVEVHGKKDHKCAIEDLLDHVFAAKRYLVPDTQTVSHKVVFLACSSSEPLMWWTTVNWINMLLNMASDPRNTELPPLVTITVNLGSEYPASHLPAGANNIVTEWRPTPAGMTADLDSAYAEAERVIATAPTAFKSRAGGQAWLDEVRGSLPKKYGKQGAHTFWSTCVSPLQGLGPLHGLGLGRNRGEHPVPISRPYLPNMFPTHNFAGSGARGNPGDFQLTARRSVRHLLAAITQELHARNAERPNLEERMRAAYAIMTRADMQHVFYNDGITAADFTEAAIRKQQM